MIGSRRLLGIIKGPFGPDRGWFEFLRVDFFFSFFARKDKAKYRRIIGQQTTAWGYGERKNLARSDPSQIGISEDHENVKHLLQQPAQHHAGDYRSGIGHLDNPLPSFPRCNTSTVVAPLMASGHLS